MPAAPAVTTLAECDDALSKLTVRRAKAIGVFDREKLDREVERLLDRRLELMAPPD